jgi:hypothetical protein
MVSQKVCSKAENNSTQNVPDNQKCGCKVFVQAADKTPFKNVQILDNLSES